MEPSIHLDGVIDGMKKCIENSHSTINKCKDKDVTLILGNTGAGKSVLFNYLLGVPLMLLENSLGMEDVIDICHTGDSSSIHQFSQIGHTYESVTLVPNVAFIGNMLLCDCPGFLDNRSAYINLSHALVIHEIMKASRGVKIILVIEFNALTTSRGALSHQVENVIKTIFPSKDMEKHLSSVLIVLSKVPLVQSGQPQKELSDIREIFKTSKSTVLWNLCDNLIVYDPLDRENLKITPVSKVLEFNIRVQSLPCIRYSELCQTPLLSCDDEILLRQICFEIQSKFDQDMYNSDRIPDLVSHYEIIKFLQRMHHPVVEKTIKSLNMAIEKILQTSYYEIELYLTNWNFIEADKLLNHWLKIVDLFGNDSTKRIWSILEQKAKESYPFQRFLKSIISATVRKPN